MLCDTIQSQAQLEHSIYWTDTHVMSLSVDSALTGTPWMVCMIQGSEECIACMHVSFMAHDWSSRLCRSSISWGLVGRIDQH